MCNDKNTKIKRRLLSLLDDSDIQKKICEIILSINKDSISDLLRNVKDERCQGEAYLSNNADPSWISRAQKAENELSRIRTELETVKSNLIKAQQDTNELTRARQELSETQAKLERSLKNAASLQAQCTELKTKEADAHTQCGQLLDQEKKIRAELTDTQTKLEHYENSILQFNAVFDLYSALPVRTKEGLKGIFNETSLRSFIICGVQKDNLLSFWDYCKTEFDRGKMEAHDPLLEIFLFFFALIKQSICGTFLYELQGVSIGDSFDKDLHSVAGMGTATGKIAQIILPGIVYANNKKVYKKSLVEVR